eukprot:5198209-Pyramimonas_sp.AAC.2
MDDVVATSSYGESCVVTCRVVLRRRATKQAYFVMPCVLCRERGLTYCGTRVYTRRRQCTRLRSDMSLADAVEVFECGRPGHNNASTLSTSEGTEGYREGAWSQSRRAGRTALDLTIMSSPLSQPSFPTLFVIIHTPL